jgi:hypothetical protein
VYAGDHEGRPYSKNLLVSLRVLRVSVVNMC